MPITNPSFVIYRSRWHRVYDRGTTPALLCCLCRCGGQNGMLDQTAVLPSPTLIHPPMTKPLSPSGAPHLTGRGAVPLSFPSPNGETTPPSTLHYAPWPLLTKRLTPLLSIPIPPLSSYLLITSIHTIIMILTGFNRWKLSILPTNPLSDPFSCMLLPYDSRHHEFKISKLFKTQPSA